VQPGCVAPDGADGRKHPCHQRFPGSGANRQRFDVQQPYRVVLIGEKTSLSEVLHPIAREIGAELLLPTGDASDTMLAAMAGRAADDGRPAVVLYFSDFDPSGFNMATSVARRLQALRDLHHPTLNIEVHRVALARDQCIAYDLPSTPLKETERRADHWRARWTESRPR
jgi:hypothetical protein